MEKISVVVPVYNVEKYLERCINSIINQSYRNLELILVDDGSTDQSGIICDTYRKQDDRIKVIHQENAGAGAARNRGMDAADGTYITFIDSDDYVAESFLERLIQIAEEKDCDIVQCGFLFGDEECHTFKNESEKEYSVLNHYEAFKTRKMKIIMCAKLFRRSLLEGIYYPKVSVHDDEFITYKLIYKAERIAIVEEPYYYYYNSSDSIMRTKREYYPENFIQAYDERIEFFRERQESELLYISYKEKCIRLAQFYGRCTLTPGNKNDKERILRIFWNDYPMAQGAPKSRKETLFLKLFHMSPAIAVRVMAFFKFI